MPPEEMALNLRPELLDHVKWKAERNLLGAIDESVSRRVANARKPGRSHGRRRIKGSKIGNIQSGVTLVIVS